MCHVTVSVLRLFLTVPLVGLWCVVMVFPGHTHIFFTFQGGVFFVNPFCYLCFMYVFVMLSFLFLATLWLLAGNWLTSCVLCFLVCLFHLPI